MIICFIAFHWEHLGKVLPRHDQFRNFFNRLARLNHEQIIEDLDQSAIALVDKKSYHQHRCNDAYFWRHEHDSGTTFNFLCQEYPSVHFQIIDD